jgi:hypothetical protein
MRVWLLRSRQPLRQSAISMHRRLRTTPNEYEQLGFSGLKLRHRYPLAPILAGAQALGKAAAQVSGAAETPSLSSISSR